MRWISSLLLASLSASAWAATSCSKDSHCPQDKPCCSQYGQCGTGAYCLGGCDPQSSFSLDSCAPSPVCENKKYTWDSLNNAALNWKYLGNATATDWVYSAPKNHTAYVEDNALVMTMPPRSVGSQFATSHYIWYGKVSGKIKSSRGQGVVTGFILLSDVKDEIDYEFVGADLSQVETNYYFQGIPDWTHGGKAKVDGGNTFEDWHTYEIDWKPESLTWSVDGKTVRTLNRDDTWNATANRFEYPQTPSRLSMSLWPAGQASNAKGTIKWAGGEIDWNSQDIKDKGYYYAKIGEVNVECYNPPAGANVKGNNSYIYTDESGLNNSVAITDKSTIMASHEATGLNMTYDPHPSSSATSSASNSVPTHQGGTGNEPGRHSGGSAGSGSSDSGSSGSSSGSNGSGSGSGSGSSGGSFSQGTSSGDSNGQNSAASPNERVVRGSFFAVLVAVIVLVTL